MFKYILIGLAIAVVIFLIAAAMQPANFRITRTSIVAAPPAAVFAQINDFHNWNAWSPWAKMDPNAKNTFEGAPSGVGAGFAWQGNNQVGEGRMKITESKPGELVRMDLEFIKPFAASNIAEFTLEPEGNQTKVTWSMSGTNSFMVKAVGMFMNCDKMVGAQFEQGFANLRAVVEKPAAS